MSNVVKLFSSPYSFKPMQESDLPLLFQWANEPHVKKWWDSESVWEEFRARYLANINSIDSFLFVAHFSNRPIGHINEKPNSFLHFKI